MRFKPPGKIRPPKPEAQELLLLKLFTVRSQTV
jgi:hypothetical protein